MKHSIHTVIPGLVKCLMMNSSAGCGQQCVLRHYPTSDAGSFVLHFLKAPHYDLTSCKIGIYPIHLLSEVSHCR